LTGEGVRAVLRALEDRLTMVYFDPRGMGKSDAVVVDADMSMKAVREDANALRAHLKLDKAIFIGWSNGAANLMMFAAEYPETVSAAIMLHGVAYFAPEEIEPIAKKYPDLFQRFGKYQQEMSASTLPASEKNKKVKQFDLEVWFPFLFADPKAGRASLKELFASAEFSYKHAMYSNAEQQSFDARPSLPKIKAPTLVIAGVHDMMPPEKVKQVADAIPNAKFVVFENSGHFSPVEERDKFVDAVVSFLRLEK
jgi:pimeloyl-ACP methyl ester carboxylesterase